jgi:hypothetical protein
MDPTGETYSSGIVATHSHSHSLARSLSLSLSIVNTDWVFYLILALVSLPHQDYWFGALVFRCLRCEHACTPRCDHGYLTRISRNAVGCSYIDCPKPQWPWAHESQAWTCPKSIDCEPCDDQVAIPVMWSLSQIRKIRAMIDPALEKPPLVMQRPPIRCLMVCYCCRSAQYSSQTFSGEPDDSREALKRWIDRIVASNSPTHQHANGCDAAMPDRLFGIHVRASNFTLRSVAINNDLPVEQLIKPEHREHWRVHTVLGSRSVHLNLCTDCRRFTVVTHEATPVYGTDFYTATATATATERCQSSCASCPAELYNRSFTLENVQALNSSSISLPDLDNVSASLLQCPTCNNGYLELSECSSTRARVFFPHCFGCAAVGRLGALRSTTGTFTRYHFERLMQQLMIEQPRLTTTLATPSIFGDIFRGPLREDTVYTSEPLESTQSLYDVDAIASRVFDKLPVLPVKAKLRSRKHRLGGGTFGMNLLFCPPASLSLSLCLCLCLCLCVSLLVRSCFCIS